MITGRSPADSQGSDESDTPPSHGSDATPSATAAANFRARLQQFEYTSAVDVDGHHRSHRLVDLLPRRTTPPNGLPPRRKRKVSTTQVSDDRSLTVADGGSRQGLLAGRPKKRRSTTKERAAGDPHHPVNHLTDSLRPGLILAFIGLNPGLMTAATGHAYAHPSNRFWHLLYDSGVTDRKHDPSETRDLMDLYQIGNTNICARPTRSGDGLSKLELHEGALTLHDKIAQFQPEAVAIVGKGIWEAIWKAQKGEQRFRDADFHWGWQDEHVQLGRTTDDRGQVVWPGAKTFVTTSTSGLAATLTPAEKLAIWKPLGAWVTKRRQDLHLSPVGLG